MEQLITKLSDPEILWVIVVAFVLGFMVRGAGRPSQVPDLSPQGDIRSKLDGVTSQQWTEIDAEIDARRKISAIRRLRQYTGLGLKDAKDAIEARKRQRDIVI